MVLTASLIASAQTAREEYNKGNDKASAQDYKGSIKHFNKALKQDPQFTDAYFNRGTSKMYLEDYEGAIEDYDKAIELNPEIISAYKNRGVAKMQTREWQSAQQDFDRVVQLEPNDASVYLMRGQVHRELGDPPSACTDFQKSKELGDSRADQLLKKYCSNSSGLVAQMESLRLDWPESEDWHVAHQQENEQIKMVELVRGTETLENWSELGTMMVYKNIPRSLNMPLEKSMEIIYESSRKDCPDSKVTMIEKNEQAEYPWIIFKLECPNKRSESQIWHAVQGTDELFVSFRAVKAPSISTDLQDTWVAFFKTAQVVTP